MRANVIAEDVAHDVLSMAVAKRESLVERHAKT